jgi:hypothetical protein
MAAPSVAWYGIGSNVGKVILADGDVGWTSGLQVDTVNFIEGTASLGEKVSNGAVERQTVNTTDVIGEPFAFSSGGGNDGDHIFAWMSIFAAWDIQANGGFGIKVVDDLATDSDGTWYVGPQEGYVGGWTSFVINPSADFDAVTAGTAVWTVTGNPAQLSGVDGFGVLWTTTVTITGNTDNGFLDAFSVGQGYRMTLGDGASAEGTFADFIAFEDVVTTGRFGGLREVSGILFAKSKLSIGFASGAGFTEFTDSGFTVVWEKQVLSDGVTSAVAAGFYEFLGEEGDDTTIVNLSQGTLKAIAPHTVVINLAGLTTCNCVAVNVERGDIITLDATNVWTDSVFTTPDQIIAPGSDLRRSSINDSTVAADTGALLWNIATNPDGLLDDMTFTMGAASHHAIDFGTAIIADITLRGIEFAGFGTSEDGDDAALRFLAASGSLDCNIIDCTVDGAAATSSNLFKDDAAGIAVTLVFSPVTLTINVKDNADVVLENARVYAIATAGGDFKVDASVTITRSTTVADVVHTAHGYVVGEKVKILGITDKVEDNNGVHTILTVVDDDSYTYLTTDSGSVSYTGTITSTGVLIEELTDVAGNASFTRTLALSQPFEGHVRKSTASPRFKTFPISGTMDNNAGLTVNIMLALDE